MIENIFSALNKAKETLSNFLKEKENLQKIDKISQEITKCFKNGNKVIICGNGGSAADAMHFAEEFTGNFRKKRAALPVIALTDSSHITCVANDFGFSKIFSRGIEAFGKKNDILIVLSTSGNSGNIIEAVQKAKQNKLKTISFLGKTGGKLKNSCVHEIIIPGDFSDRIQELHMLILHIVIEIVERYMFPENY
ncbi:MAG: SIS domain-containing protein [Candidatus Cloacimonetes bacterium]|nr:SIS domain-containing protein [Candidatus Cloacimonadota bacterium]